MERLCSHNCWGLVRRTRRAAQSFESDSGEHTARWCSPSDPRRSALVAVAVVDEKVLAYRLSRLEVRVIFVESREEFSIRVREIGIRNVVPVVTNAACEFDLSIMRGSSIGVSMAE